MKVVYVLQSARHHKVWNDIELPGQKIVFSSTAFLSDKNPDNLAVLAETSEECFAFTTLLSSNSRLPSLHVKLHHNGRWMLSFALKAALQPEQDYI